MLIQFLILGVIVFSISGALGLVALILGEISIAELLAYFEGIITGESLILGGTFLRLNWKKIVEDFWDWIEGNDGDSEVVSEAKIEELKKLIRR